MRRVVVGIVWAIALAGGVLPTDAATTGTIEVLADGDAGWRFNRDPRSSTPYVFTGDQRSLGEGSLHVLPITNAVSPGEKFVAELPLGIPSTDLRQVAYDFLIAGPDAGPASATHFYLNVYVTLPGSTSWFDCRFDYVPTTGSTTAFSTAAFAIDLPTRTASAGASCAATPARMPAGSTIVGIALNVGQSNSRDTGIGGYLDNVVVTTLAGATTYDLDVPTPIPTKDECRDGGWRDRGFKNQGACTATAARA